MCIARLRPAALLLLLAIVLAWLPTRVPAQDDPQRADSPTSATVERLLRDAQATEDDALLDQAGRGIDALLAADSANAVYWRWRGEVHLYRASAAKEIADDEAAPRRDRKAARRLASAEALRSADALARSARLDPNVSEVHTLLATCALLQIDGLGSAIARKPDIEGHLAAAERLDPTNAWVPIIRAQIELHFPGVLGGDRDKGIASLRQGITLLREPDDFPYQSLADALAKRGDLDEARAMYARALEINPRNRRVAERLAALAAAP